MTGFIPVGAQSRQEHNLTFSPVKNWSNKFYSRCFGDGGIEPFLLEKNNL
jgi:hypothetical protein